MNKKGIAVAGNMIVDLLYPIHGIPKPGELTTITEDASKSIGGCLCNARMGPEEMRKHCQLNPESEQLMRQAFEAMGLTARSYDRILKVARTIADLEGSPAIEPQHIAEAIQYRTVNLGNP